MKNLIRKILREESDWDWARDIKPNKPFEEFEVGDEVTWELIDHNLITKVMETCSLGSLSEIPETIKITNTSVLSTNADIICGCDDDEYEQGFCGKEVETLSFDLTDNEQMWVTGDMMRFFIKLDYK